MSNPREVASKLYKTALAHNVRFPKIWDESKCIQSCGAILMVNRSSDGFDETAALEELINKYGIEQNEIKSITNDKKRKATTSKDDLEENENKHSTEKKIKKTEIVIVEGNRFAAEAIKEMGDIYYKNKELMKGGCFSKAAKALRECDTYISTAKEAMKLKGIGKAVASYIEELLLTGKINKLEELRAGTA